MFIDYKGFAGKGYNPAGRNLGLVEIVPGGVARNVAVNMSRLDVETWFVGTLNQDSAGDNIKKKMTAAGIHLEHAALVPQGGAGAWLALIGPDGELLGSVSQMPDTDLMYREIISRLPNVLPKVDGILLEVDLSEKLARAIIGLCLAAGKKLYVLPGNLSVIGKHFDLFKAMECFVCNHEEACRLLGKDAFSSTSELLDLAVKFSRRYSLKNFVITLGEKGALYISADGQSGRQKIYPVTVVDSTGAGDAFFSGTVAALLHGKTLSDAVDAGARLASLVIADRSSDCSSLTALDKEQLLR